MNISKNRIIDYVIIVVIFLITTQCSTAPDPSPPLQTRILQVKVQPNPVAVGDTATFTCIIADSMDSRFKFYWGFDDVLGDTVTEDNIIEWIAPNNPGEFLHTVTVNNGTEPDSIPTNKGFTIEVISNQE